MASKLINLQNTGFSISDIIWDWCKKQSDGSSVSTASSTLTARAEGWYVLTNPNITVDTDFKIHISGDVNNYAVDVFTVVAEVDLSAIVNAIAALQEDLGNPSADATTIYAAIVASGTGARQVTIQLCLTATTTPIASVNIQIWNSAQTVLIASGVSDTLGQKVFALNDATYKVRLSKIGSNFTVPETIIVSADSTKTLYGDVINIGTPASALTCRVYDYLYNPDDGTIPTTATIYAQIISLPYDYNGKIHAGSRITGTYNSTTGLIYWDLVYGATVEFTNTAYFGDSSITKVIPELTTKRFSEIQ